MGTGASSGVCTTWPEELFCHRTSGHAEGRCTADACIAVLLNLPGCGVVPQTPIGVLQESLSFGSIGEDNLCCSAERRIEAEVEEIAGVRGPQWINAPGTRRS